MKKLSFLYLSIFIVIGVISCEDAPEGIQAALFDETGTNTPALSFSASISYDTGGNFLANWDELVGIDVQVTNNLDNLVTDIEIQLIDFQESSNVVEFPSETREISFLSQFSTVTPQNYWCFNCNEFNEIRIGNFYFVTTPGSGNADMTLTFRASFDYEDNEYEQEFQRVISVF